MRGGRACIVLVGVTASVCASATLAAAPQRAAANPLKPLCTVGGLVSGVIGKACGVLQNSGKVVSAGKKLLSGHVGAAAKTMVGDAAPTVGTAAGLAAVGAWVLGGARGAIAGTAALIDRTTSPQLDTTWFSSTYWRMAGIAAVLTLPFLFAAAVQAVMRSDLALLARSAFGYLPLALLAVSIAAPVTMLLLSASDQMSAIVSSAAGGDAARALDEIGGGIGLASTFAGSPFLAFLLGLLLAGGAFTLWLELLVRDAAVYVVVLLLPLAFSAFVWPARRVWAVRAVELLLALILAKFAIVAVLTLAAAGLGHRWLNGPTAMLSGLALVTLAAFAPWALVRLLPMAEVASSAAGSLRREATAALPPVPGPGGEEADGSEEIRADDGSASGGRTPQAREAAEAMRERMDDLRDASRTTAERADGVANPGGAEAAAWPSAFPEDQPAPGAQPGPDAPPRAPAEATEDRLPGMPAPWQQDDMSWPVTVLGPEGVRPFPADDKAAPALEPHDRTPEPPDALGPVDASAPAPPDAPADEHDPLPPKQEPDGGAL